MSVKILFSSLRLRFPPAQRCIKCCPGTSVAPAGPQGCHHTLAAGITPTVIDHDANTVDSARRYGFKVYFGDATHRDLRQTREQFEREMQADLERQARQDGKAGWHGR